MCFGSARHRGEDETSKEYKRHGDTVMKRIKDTSNFKEETSDNSVRPLLDVCGWNILDNSICLVTHEASREETPGVG
jgi:hypothetical protein